MPGERVEIIAPAAAAAHSEAWRRLSVDALEANVAAFSIPYIEAIAAYYDHYADRPHGGREFP